MVVEDLDDTFVESDREVVASGVLVDLMSLSLVEDKQVLGGALKLDNEAVCADDKGLSTTATSQVILRIGLGLEAELTEIAGVAHRLRIFSRYLFRQ